MSLLSGRFARPLLKCGKDFYFRFVVLDPGQGSPNEQHDHRTIISLQFIRFPFAGSRDFEIRTLGVGSLFRLADAISRKRAEVITIEKNIFRVDSKGTTGITAFFSSNLSYSERSECSTSSADSFHPPEYGSAWHGSPACAFSVNAQTDQRSDLNAFHSQGIQGLSGKGRANAPLPV